MSHVAKNQTNPIVIEVTGYAPYVNARAARACKGKVAFEAKQRAAAIRDYWVKQHFLNELNSYVVRHDKDLFRSQWECAADKKGLHSRVKWEMSKVTSRMNDDLERRKSKLAEMLKSEEEMYLQEVEQPEEDEKERTARMLERYKELKVRKEKERQKIAKEKKEQHFRINCDELRSLVSKRVQEEIAKEGQQIALEREQEMKQKTQDEKMFAEMWIKDSEAKRLKEEKEEECKRLKNMEFGRCINEQREKIELEKYKKVLQKEKEAEIMAEQKRLHELEEEWKKHEKKKMQEETKNNLDMCMKAKLKQKAKEVQNDLMEDLYFLKKIMDNEEDTKKANRKKALMNEQQQFLAYLREQLKKESAFEKEVDKMYKAELDKVWEKREEEWAAERKKRKQLEKDVLKECEEQIVANMEKGRLAYAMHKSYAEKILKQDEIDRKEDLEKLKLIKERNAAHQKDLLDQMRVKSEKMQASVDHNMRQLQQLAQERKDHEEKLKKLLSEFKLDYEHPIRSRTYDARSNRE